MLQLVEINVVNGMLVIQDSEILITSKRHKRKFFGDLTEFEKDFCKLS